MAKTHEKVRRARKTTHHELSTFAVRKYSAKQHGPPGAVLFRAPFSLIVAGLVPYYLGLTVMLLTLAPPAVAIGQVA